MPSRSMTATWMASRADRRRLPRTMVRARNGREIDREDLVHEAQHGIEGRLDRVEAVDGDVAMENLLEHLGVGHEALPLGDAALQEPLRVRLQGMRGPHQVHGDVGVDEDHRRGSPTYPRSISVSIWLISPVGKV